MEEEVQRMTEKEIFEYGHIEEEQNQLAPLEDEDVFMEIPAGCYHKDSDSTKDHVLRIKKNLYGLE
eukprot:1334258-Ditylum_brightwellii.AAC.1